MSSNKGLDKFIYNMLQLLKEKLLQIFNLPKHSQTHTHTLVKLDTTSVFQGSRVAGYVFYSLVLFFYNDHVFVFRLKKITVNLRKKSNKKPRLMMVQLER